MKEYRNCRECGERFLAERKDKIYCGQKCYRKAHTRMTNERIKADTKKEKPIKKCEKKKEDQLDKYKRLAMVHGMTYGQYVAKTEYPVKIERKW